MDGPGERWGKKEGKMGGERGETREEEEKEEATRRRREGGRMEEDTRRRVIEL